MAKEEIKKEELEKVEGGLGHFIKEDGVCTMCKEYKRLAYALTQNDRFCEECLKWYQLLHPEMGLM